jgi:hypothetical protein
VELSFFWRSERLDVLRFDALSSPLAPVQLFVSIHAPMQLARAAKPIIEEQLRIVDEHGIDYGIDVEPVSFGAAERYGMINGYVWQRGAAHLSTAKN